MGITFFITEPRVDTFLFSYKNFVKQISKGFLQLFSKEMVKYTILILLLGSFTSVAYEILDDVAVVEWGYQAMSISVLYTIVIIVSVPSSLHYEQVSNKIKPRVLVTIGILFLALNYLLSPWINAIIWTMFFLGRVVFSPIKNAAVTDIINQYTDSNIRATTLSTYELLTKLPFVLLGVSIGSALNIFGVKYFSTAFSVTLLVLLIVYFAVNKIISIRNQTQRLLTL